MNSTQHYPSTRGKAGLRFRSAAGLARDRPANLRRCSGARTGVEDNPEAPRHARRAGGRHDARRRDRTRTHQYDVPGHPHAGDEQELILRAASIVDVRWTPSHVRRETTMISPAQSVNAAPRIRRWPVRLAAVAICLAIVSAYHNSFRDRSSSTMNRPCWIIRRSGSFGPSGSRWRHRRDDRQRTASSQPYARS